MVSELFHLYRYDYAFIEMVGKEANDERIQLLKPYLIENIYLEDEITFPLMRTDIPRVLQDRVFRNICLGYEKSSYSAYNSYRLALERLVRIDRLIEGELNK